MSNQLLPCPFCGGEARFVPADYVDEHGEPLPFAECDPCGTGAPVTSWNRRATQPAAGEPVAIANRGKGAFWVKWTDAAEGLYGPGIKLYAAPPAAAHGDEAVLWEMLEGLRTATDRQALPGAFIRVMWEAGCDWINAHAAMRAQGDVDGDGK